MNERLYCAHHESLNDPFEGLFSTIEWKGGGSIRPAIRSAIRPAIRDVFGNYPQRVYKTLDQIPSLNKGARVCSLSGAMSDVRMWSLYSSGHTGCVVEFDIDLGEELVEVQYEDGLQHFKNKIDQNTKAVDVLSFKTSHWEYEKEYRIISDENFYSVSGRITGIYLGVRVKDIHKEIILRSTSKDIPVYETKINEKTVEIKPNKRVN